MKQVMEGRSTDDRQLQNALDEARDKGWVVVRTTLATAIAAAQSLGASPIPPRSRSPVLSRLEPLDPERARPYSLSTQFGMGPLPLHTDGAHFRTPPEFVLLASSSGASDVTTKVFKLPSTLKTSGGWLALALRQGIFAVGRGLECFLAPVLGQDGILRYDPGCMRPLDKLASQAAEYFSSAGDSALRFRWEEGSSVLIIHNWGTLHGRSDATGEPSRRIDRLMLGM